MKVLVVTPHLESFVRDQMEQIQPHVEQLAALIVRPRPALFDPQRSSRIGSDRGLPVSVKTCRSVFLRTRWPWPMDGLSAAGSVLGRLLDRGSFDLVHGHFLFPPGGLAVRAARSRRIPVVVTGHGFDVYRLPFRNARWARRIREVLSACSAAIAVSQANARIFRDLGAVAQKVHVIPNGFDPSLFHLGPQATARERLQLPGDATILLAVGHLVPIKGHEVLLRALVRLPASALLVILGRGPLMKSLQRLAVRLGVSSRVRFRGEVPHTVVGEYMRAADLVLIASHMEGNPTVLFEALGSGRPVVASRVGGIPDIVTDDLGILTEPGDPAQLSMAVQEAINRPWDAVGIARTADRWAWPRLASDVLAVYRRVVTEEARR